MFGCGWYMLATLMHTDCEDLYLEESSESQEFMVLNGVDVSVDEYIQSECPWIYR